MKYSIALQLDKGWKIETETFIDESGVEIAHASAVLRTGREGDQALIDVYLGDMPDGDTAEDQAFANYVETVGFGEEDPEDFNPIEKITFNGKNGYAFDAVCEDDAPMRFISQEVKKGLLAIMTVVALNEELLEKSFRQLERGLRIHKAEE